MKLRHADEYTDRGTQAAHSVLIELGQVLGAYRQRFVVVGGIVPLLLLGHAEPKHRGTTDIDLMLDPTALGGDQYTGLAEALEEQGYRPGDRAFQFIRDVDVRDGGPHFL